jgi:chromosome segregation ATPase
LSACWQALNEMKKETPIFRTPEPLKWLFVAFLLLPVAMMAHNAYQLLEGEKVVLVGEKGDLIDEVAQLKANNLKLGVAVEGLEGELAQAKLENERLLVAKHELEDEIGAVRVQIGYHESREDSLQRVIDLLKNEIVATERKVGELKRESQVAAQAFRRMGASEVADSGALPPEIAEQNYFELVKTNEKLARQTEENDRQALELLSEISELNTELNYFKTTQDDLKGKVADLNQELLEKRTLIDAIAVRQSN